MLLVQAVAPDEYSVAHGLANWDEFAKNPYSLAVELFNMSKPKKPAPAKAPVVRKGTFLPVLKVVHRALIDISNEPTDDGIREFVIDIFQRSIIEFKIRFFPAQMAKSSSMGRPCTKPIFNSWGNLGEPDKKLNSGKRSSTPPIVHPAKIASYNAMGGDTNVGWNANKLSFGKLKNFLNKMTLPSDYTLPSRSTIAPYVDETYDWVRDNYDGTKPLHHLALLTSIIVSSTLLPNMFIPEEAKALFINATTEHDVRRIYDNLEWKDKKKGGQTERCFFISMFTTLIIALYEEKSPLRRHMAASSRQALGSAWTTKHSQPFPLVLLRSHNLILSLSSLKRHHLQQPYSP
jgi:hypothetical protein